MREQMLIPLNENIIYLHYVTLLPNLFINKQHAQRRQQKPKEKSCFALHSQLPFIIRTKQKGDEASY